MTTVLGDGRHSSQGDGGPAVEASVLMPDSLCIDAHDNMYVGEKYGYRVRRVDAATGIVSTIVGTGVPGWGEEGLHGSETRCNSCESGIWADPDGTVHWSDCSGRLRRYDGATGIVTTALGGTHVGDGGPAVDAFLRGPAGICVGPDGHVYFADPWNQRIRAIDPLTGTIRTVAGSGARAFGGDNGPALEASFGSPHDVSVDSRGRVVIADSRHGRLRRVDEDGMVRTVAGTAFKADLGDGAPAVSASLYHVQAVAHGPNDDIYVGDAVGRIRRIDAVTGVIATVAGAGIQGWSGDGGPAVRARIGAPSAIRIARDGSLYFTDAAFHVVRRVDAAGTISTVAGTGEPGFSPDGTQARNARIEQPWGLAVDRGGRVYFSDSFNNRVRRIEPDGTLTTVAGSGEAGDAGDGGEATGARLNEPHGICLYSQDLLLVSDYYNNRIRAVRLDELGPGRGSLEDERCLGDPGHLAQLVRASDLYVNEALAAVLSPGRDGAAVGVGVAGSEVLDGLEEEAASAVESAAGGPSLQHRVEVAHDGDAADPVHCAPGEAAGLVARLARLAACLVPRDRGSVDLGLGGRVDGEWVDRAADLDGLEGDGLHRLVRACLAERRRL